MDGGWSRGTAGHEVCTGSRAHCAAPPVCGSLLARHLPEVAPWVWLCLQNQPVAHGQPPPTVTAALCGARNIINQQQTFDTNCNLRAKDKVETETSPFFPISEN